LASLSKHGAGEAIHNTDSEKVLFRLIQGETTMATVNVRYIVNDVDAAIAFYCDHLDFQEVMHPAPTFAILARGDLRLLLSAHSTQGGGGQSMPDGTKPEPGGWNRISLEVSGLEAIVKKLRQQGIHFRNDIVIGVGGNQILLEDPSGNPVELFESTYKG
jgi:catechol 2,3-dioxygenase-like lactoylglutathione lyase family enzyme